MARAFIYTRDITDMFEFPDDNYFLRRRKQLETKLGFPPPCLWARNPMRWRRVAVENWFANIDQISAAASVDGGDDQGNVVMMLKAKVA